MRARQSAKKSCDGFTRNIDSSFPTTSSRPSAGLPDHFPGFRYESLSGDRGWGAGISRDDVRRGGNSFSRLEVAIRPFSSSHVVELTAKGTISNKEIFNRTHIQRIWEVDLASYRQMIDLWIIEYAERYAAHV